MNWDELKIGEYLGIALKHMRNCKNNTVFINEFNALRHGNYVEFIKLVGVGVSNNMIGRNLKLDGNDMVPIVDICCVGDALDKFILQFPNFPDFNIPDDVYTKLGLFELRIRSKTLIYNRPINDNLELAINSLNAVVPIDQLSIQKLHAGRKQLNNIKHPIDKKGNIKPFDINIFNEAFETLNKFNIKIID